MHTQNHAMFALLNFPRPFVLLLGALCLLLATAAQAQGTAAPLNTAVGLWRSIDDNTGKPQALVRITESNGEVSGRIEKLFPGVSDDPNPRCAKCEGARKDQPVIGMTILSGLKRGRDQNADEYSGGEILDPDNGSVYRALLTLAEGGRKLKVRGYIGVSLFGRTQVWERVE